MKSKGKSYPGKKGAMKRSSEERGDISAQCLHRTIVVCGVALIGVLLFAFSPRKKTKANSAATPQTEAQVQTASFERGSLSTKNR